MRKATNVLGQNKIKRERERGREPREERERYERFEPSEEHREVEEKLRNFFGWNSCEES